MFQTLAVYNENKTNKQTIKLKKKKKREKETSGWNVIMYTERFCSHRKRVS